MKCEDSTRRKEENRSFGSEEVENAAVDPTPAQGGFEEKGALERLGRPATVKPWLALSILGPVLVMGGKHKWTNVPISLVESIEVSYESDRIVVTRIKLR